MGIGGGVSDPVSSDYEWVVTGDASTPIFCKFSLFSSPFSPGFLDTVFLETMPMTRPYSCFGKLRKFGLMMSCYEQTKIAATNFLVFMELFSIEQRAKKTINFCKQVQTF